jgi:hypothetical protein
MVAVAMPSVQLASLAHGWCSKAGALHKLTKEKPSTGPVGTDRLIAAIRVRLSHFVRPLRAVFLPCCYEVVQLFFGEFVSLKERVCVYVCVCAG